MLMTLLISAQPLVFAAKFNLGNTVEVYNTSPSYLKVRLDPAGEVIGRKYDGDRGMVIDGPVSALLPEDGKVYTWWKVRWGDDALEGWSAEDYLKYAYISPSTKFSIGNLVKVSTGGSSLIVRTDPPALSYKGSVADGTVGKVLGGPFYGVPQGASGFYYFWKVDYLSIVGWSAEDWLTKVVGEPVITSSLVLVQSPPYYVGDTITARFTITNRATAPFTFDVLTVGGRDPDNQVADFTWIRSITLSPGSSYNYQGTLTLTKVGNYHFFCAYRTPWGDWNTAIPTEGGATNTLDIYVNPTPPPPNQPPYTPYNPSPSNHATGVSIYADLSWSGGDPDASDTVTYDVYFGVSPSPPLVSSGQSATSYDPGTLSYGTTYYWKIVAKDNHGASTTGPVWDFTTQPAPPPPNQPPYTPYNPSPPNHATGVSIYADLTWSGGDPDVGDTVTYDVYFGTSTPSPLVSNDQSATTYDPGTLSYSTTYYWKIVATDNHGASAEGPVWDFTTQSAPPNQPPYEPTAASQYRSDGTTVIPEGGATPESTVVFKATISDPDGDSVRLEIELRQIGEAFTGEPTPETISDYVSSGSQVTITRHDLVNADYHWRYRAKDSHGATSDWTEFGTTGNIDFTVSLLPTPKITGIDPSKPIAFAYQYLTILGEGFVPDSEAYFNDGVQDYRIPKERIRFIGSDRIDVVAGLGYTKCDWTVWIINPDGAQSDKFPLQTRDSSPEDGLKVFEIAKRYWKDEDTALLMTTIAWLESGWSSNSAGDLAKDWGIKWDTAKKYNPNINSMGACSWGLWQILMPANIKLLESLAGTEDYNEIAKWLRDPNNNANAAHELLNKNRNNFKQLWPRTYPEAIEKKEEVAKMLGIKRVSSFKCPVNVTISDEYGRIISEVENQIPGASFEYFNATDTKIFYLPLNLTYHVQINATAYGNITIGQMTPTESVYEIAFSHVTFNLTNETAAEFDLLPFNANFTLKIDENGDGTIDYELIPEVETLTFEYDIGIAEIAPLKTVVGQGYNLPINMTIVNTGAYTETFDVTVYANETIIAVQTITLANGTSATYTFIWNTTGFAPGNYTISAYASPLLGETNTADNTYTNGTVQILQIYTLTIITTVGGTTDPAPGTYSYTANSSVQVTAIPNADYVFDHWELDMVNVGSANPYTVLMDKNHTLKAVFSPIPPPLSASISPLSASILVGQSVTFTSTVSGGYTPYTYQWYLNGNPVSGATSNTWVFTPTTGGIYYVHLKVTDAKGSTAQSDTARITAATVPVGGYSIPIDKYTIARPLITYTAIVTILTATFIKMKRKAKRKR
jgi:hypothetical protein